jgi:hypothetical protein
MLAPLEGHYCCILEKRGTETCEQTNKPSSFCVLYIASVLYEDLPSFFQEKEKSFLGGDLSSPEGQTCHKQTLPNAPVRKAWGAHPVVKFHKKVSSVSSAS